MYSITSIFETSDGKNSNDMWQELENHCEFAGLKKTTIPHFSWQTAESYQIDLLKAKLSQISRNICPFKFQTSGIGVFSNHRKVLFLIIVKTRKLMDLHEMIWRETIQLTEAPNLSYSPENWIPHISLNLNELGDDQFICAVKELTKSPLRLEFEVKQIGLIYLTLHSSGIDSVYPLLGKDGQ